MSLYQGKKKIPAKIKAQRNKILTIKLAKQLKPYHKKLSDFLKYIGNA